MPADTNYAGSIFGGWILSQVDIAGSIAAIRRARGPITTVAVNSVEFHEPVFVGDLVSCYAEVSARRAYFDYGSGRGLRRTPPGPGRMHQSDPSRAHLRGPG